MLLLIAFVSIAYRFLTAFTTQRPCGYPIQFSRYVALGSATFYCGLIITATLLNFPQFFRNFILCVENAFDILKRGDFMARLTNEEKQALSQNMTRLNQKNKYSIDFVSKHTGIPKRTYESYLYCESGASQTNLEKLADFYKTTIKLLLSPNANLDEIALGKAIRDYKKIWDSKTETLNDEITSIIKERFKKDYFKFFRLLEALGYTIEFSPTISLEEKKAYENEIIKYNWTRRQIYTAQYLKKWTPMEKLKEDVGKNTFEMMQLFFADKEFSGRIDEKEALEDKSNQDAIIDEKIELELFIQKYINGDYDKIPDKDFPLEIHLKLMKDDLSSSQLRSLEYIEDYERYTAEYHIYDFIELATNIFGNIDDMVLGNEDM